MSDLRRVEGPPFRPAGETSYDLVLRILDHQVVGPDGQFLGKVDGAELVRDGDDLWVTGLAVGLQPLAARLPGRLGTWTAAIWRRFHPFEHPQANVVPISHVTRLGPSVVLDRGAAEALARTFGIELWLREYVISRIPGATGGGDERDAAQTGPPETEAARRELPPRRDAMPVTALLGARVEDEHGRLVGRVWEMGCVGAPIDRRQGPLKVTHVRAARHRLAADLGYGSEGLTGPALIRWPARFSQRHDRLIPIGELDMSRLEEDGVLRLGGQRGWRAHPRPAERHTSPDRPIGGG
jgi:hypothetical protein